ncbi:MAG: HAD-IA family hydrolase [Alphaproteobacteria bacterium]|nr:HAD-IA family hydrolase [Alphaproteobacteria bacterium]
MLPSLLIFDCDGTLVDTEPLQNLAVAQLLAEEGLKGYDAEIVRARFTGIKFSIALKEITGETGHAFPPDMGPRYITRVRELYPTHFRRIEGAEELVAKAARRMKICVGSNGQRDNVIDSLNLAGLGKYFPDENIFTAIMVENPKPAPDLFLLAAQKMKTDPTHCLVLEDSVPGVRAAVAAGMKTWGFTGTHDKAEHETRLKEAGAHEIFSSLARVRQALFG